MTSNCLRAIALMSVVAAASLIGLETEAAGQQVVFAPYGAHRGRIVIGPFRQKIWWGNGLTPYGAATIQHTVSVGGDVLTDENFLSTLTNLVSRELKEQETRARSLNECTQALEKSRQIREGLELALAGARTPAVRPRKPDAPAPKGLEGIADADAQAVADYLESLKAIRLKIGALAEGPAAVKQEGQAVIEQGNAIRNRLKGIKTSLDKLDAVIEQGNQALQPMLDALSAPGDG